MALVPAGPGRSGESDPGALVPWGAGALGETVEAKLVRLREAREAHSRKQIWTKDAHGGPYRKVNANKGYDPLLQLPDGRERPAELGYERVKGGPTSNFVGNHMTQGAIDLVQAQLEPPAQRSQRTLGGTTPAQLPPQRLLAGEGAERAGQSSVPPPRPLQRWQWADAGASVRLEVPLEQLPLLGAGATATASCTFEARRLELLLHVAGDSSGGQTGTAHRLLLHPLHATVVPSRCRCYVTGLPAILPASGASEPASGVEVPVAVGSAAGGGGTEHSVRFALPPGATALVLELAKSEAQQPWEALQGALLPLAPAQPPSAGPDLAQLRRAVRQQLGRAKTSDGSTAAAAAATQPAAPATPTPEAPVAVPTAAEAEHACQAALQAGEALAAVGRHADALAATAACLPLALAAPGGQAVRLHALRGQCQAQLGALKQAAAEYTAGLAAARRAEQGGDGQGQHRLLLCQLLLARSALHEQQERLADALADAQEAAALRQPAVPAAALAAARLRRAVKRAGEL